MLYSSLDSASNDSLTLKNKYEQYDINKFDNYTDININYPSYFTAQGDYAHNNYMEKPQLTNPYINDNNVGTTINQLKNNNKNNDTNNYTNNYKQNEIPNDTNNQSLIDSLSFDNNTLSDEISLIPKSKKKNNTKNKNNDTTKYFDHDYCVKIITKELLNNDDATLMSSHNGKIYKHVKNCDICKNKIKKNMKDQYCDKIENNIIDSKPNNIEHFKVPEEQSSVIGYDIKELVLIILGGIILIFVFDLLVKMGEKLPK